MIPTHQNQPETSNNNNNNNINIDDVKMTTIYRCHSLDQRCIPAISKAFAGPRRRRHPWINLSEKPIDVFIKITNECLLWGLRGIHGESWASFSSSIYLSYLYEYNNYIYICKYYLLQKYICTHRSEFFHDLDHVPFMSDVALRYK